MQAGGISKESGVRTHPNLAQQNSGPKPTKPGPATELFVDANFPKGLPDPAGEIVWKRPKELCASPQFIIDGASRTDICQGSLGDCWFLSAVASLTLHQPLMDQVIPEGQGFGSGYTGRFTFKFWQYGHWQEVEVDDFLPTVKGELIFLRSRERGEFWSPLLEKAYAKLKGGYHALHLGFPHEALVDMTGGVTEEFQMGALPRDTARFLRQLLDKGSLINCANVGGPLEQRNEKGILFKHAYTVTGVAQVQAGSARVDLVRVRNPWGHTEWTGAWSDQEGAAWSQVSTAEQNRVQRVQLEDGEFWMSVSDFHENFTTVEVCHLTGSSLSESGSILQPWQCALHQGSWVRGISAGGPPQGTALYWLNPQFRLTLLEEDDDPNDPALTCSFLVALMQKNWRQQGAYLNIALHLYQVSPEQTYLSPIDLLKVRPVLYLPAYSAQREVVIRGRLAPGHYIIIPSTASANQEGEFILRVYTEKGNGAIPADKAVTDSHKADPAPSVSSPLPSLDAVQDLFKQHAAPGGVCGAAELQAVLRGAVRRGALANSAEGFCLERCKSIVSLMDTRGFGRLEWTEFCDLWVKFSRWTVIFVRFDKNQSESLDYPEIIPALQGAGLQVDDFVLQLIGLRYTDPDRTVSYPAFLCFMLKLDTMIRRFQSMDQLGSGSVSLNYRQWLHMTMYN